jgi:mannosyltransferase
MSVEVLEAPTKPHADQPAVDPSVGDPMPRWVWGLVVGVAALLRFGGLGTSMLTFDETFTAEAARLAPSKLLSFLRTHDRHPPLDYLVRHPFASAGMSELWIRLPSAVLSTAAVLVAVWWWRRYGRAGLLAASFLALGSFSITYARDARMYAGLELVGISVAALSHHWLSERDRGGAPGWNVWLLLWVACLSGLLLQAGALLVVPAVALVPGLARDRDAWRWRFTVLAAGLTWAALWGPSFLAQLKLGDSWIPLTTPSYLASVVNELVDSFPAFRFYVMALLAAAGALLPRRAPRRVWIVVGLLPVVMAALAGVWVHLLLPRTLAFASWVPCLSLGFLIDRVLRRSLLVGAGAILLAAVIVLPSTADAVTNNGASEAPAFRYVRTVVRPGDEVVVSPAWLDPMVRWYFDVRWFQGGVQVDRTDLRASGVSIGPAPTTGRAWLVVSRSYVIADSGQRECGPRLRFGDFTVVCLGP